MMFKILFIICVTIFVILTITFFEDIKKSNRKKISFKEALNLTDLPVVTFICNGKKLNFLLDTGANNSVLNASVADKLKVEIVEFDGVDTDTAGGTICVNKAAHLHLKYDNKRIYEDLFILVDMTEAFESTKKETGVQLHGLLGSNFFAKYKYIIDYDSLALYVK